MQRDFHAGTGPDSLAEYIRAAAARAMELAPRQPQAQVALVMLLPLFREWGAFERAVRSLLAELPDHAALLDCLGRLLAQT